MGACSAARSRSCARALREIREAIDAYKRASDDGVIEKPFNKSGYPPSLALLVEGAVDKKDAEGARIYFLRRIPVDPMSAEPWALRSYASPADAPGPGRTCSTCTRAVIRTV